MPYIFYAAVTFTILTVHIAISIFAFDMELPNDLRKNRAFNMFGYFNIIAAILSTICYHFSCKILKYAPEIKYSIIAASISTISALLILFALKKMGIPFPIMITHFITAAAVPFFLKRAD